MDNQVLTVTEINSILDEHCWIPVDFWEAWRAEYLIHGGRMPTGQDVYDWLGY